MNIKQILEIKEIYSTFRNNLEENLDNSDGLKIYKSSEDCYLIEESWNNEFNQFFTSFQVNNFSKIYNIDFLENKPIFIETFSSAISYLKNNVKFSLISKELIKNLYEDNLNDIPIVHYYANNSKIIIEFKNNVENKALLIINPLSYNLIKKNIFVLSFSKKEKIFFFNELLSKKDNIKMINDIKFKNNLFPIEIYINTNLIDSKADTDFEENKINIPQKFRYSASYSRYDTNSSPKRSPFISYYKKYTNNHLSTKNKVYQKKKCNNSICKSRTPVNQKNNSKKRDSDLNTNRKIYERELSENLSNKVGCFNNKHKRKKQRIITNSFTANNNFNDKIILKKSNLEKIKSNLFQNNIKINDYLSTNPINHYESNRNLLSEKKEEDDIKELKYELNNLKEEYNKIQNDLKIKQSKIIQLEEENNKIKIYFNLKEEEIKLLKKETKEKEMDNKMDLDIQKNLVKKKENINIKLKKDLEDKEKQLEKINDENNLMKNEIVEAQKELNKMLLNKQYLENQILFIKVEGEKKDEIIKEKNNNIKNLEKKYSDIKNELTDMKKKTAILLIDKAAQSSKIKQKENEIKKLQQSLDEINIKNQILEKTKIELDNKIKEYESKEVEKNKTSLQIQNNNSFLSYNENDKQWLINFVPKSLKYIEDTYYLNATLQCLSQTESLKDYFLNNNSKFNINEHPLSYNFFELLKKLWERNEIESINPENFKNLLEKLEPKSKNNTRIVFSKILIINILNHLHSELKKSNNKFYFNKPLNQYNEVNSLNYFLSENFNKTSIISDLFYGIIQTTNECFNCKSICYNYDTFSSLIFPLEEINNIKINNNQNNSLVKNNNIVTIDDCFNYHQNRYSFNKYNIYYCNICKGSYNSFYTTKIYTSPNILILIIIRNTNNINKIKIDIQEKIDITNYVLQKEIYKIIYNLYGVISFVSENKLNQYFIASCKNPVDWNWYRYKDINITPIKDIQKEVIEYGTPCILFYKKEKSF